MTGRLLPVALLAALSAGLAQELEPRAYSISPRDVNFFVAGVSRATGGISFDPNLPVEEAEANLQAVSIAYARSITFFGRSANVGVHSAYIRGPLQGIVNGEFEKTRRSGLAPPAARFAVNLFGGPAMDREQFAHYQRKTLVGASVVVVSPFGQYDSDRVINLSSHRWAFKPELGFSRRVARWQFDAYVGAWLFAANPDFLGKVRTQEPIASMQVHVSYNIKPRFWAAFNTNFYAGGRTSVDGVRRFDMQRNSRVGATVAVPLTRRHSVKCSVSSGARTSVGASFTSIALGYQVMWGGGL